MSGWVTPSSVLRGDWILTYSDVSKTFGRLPRCREYDAPPIPAPGGQLLRTVPFECWLGPVHRVQHGPSFCTALIPSSHDASVLVWVNVVGRPAGGRPTAFARVLRPTWAWPGWHNHFVPEEDAVLAALPFHTRGQLRFPSLPGREG